MNTNTAFFSVDILSPHLQEFQRTYCAYCGKGLTMRADTGGYVWQCDCDLAQKELILKAEVQQAERALEDFYITNPQSNSIEKELEAIREAMAIIKGETE